MRILAWGLVWLFGSTCQAAQPEAYAFGVTNQRNLQAIAAYWNPILRYVSARSGVPLELRVGRTASETTERVVSGEMDFAYTNHLFTPARAQLGWRVLARQDTPGIQGQIVVPAHSPITSLADLSGRVVAFSNPYSPVGHYVPMDTLMRAGVRVFPVFFGNPEAAMGYLMAGQVTAAGVNNRLMADFAQRTGLKYRVLSESKTYPDLAVMASPRIAATLCEKVRQAFVGMAADPEGARVLQQAADSAGQPRMRGFVAANDADYADYKAFFSRTVVPLNE